MTKNILKKYFIQDIFDDDENINAEDIDNNNISNQEIIESNVDGNSDSESEDLNSDYEMNDDSIPKIEFIVEEDENREKQIRMNFEFKVKNSNEVVKIDLEISKNTYLEIADELLK